MWGLVAVALAFLGAGAALLFALSRKRGYAGRETTSFVFDASFGFVFVLRLAANALFRRVNGDFVEHRSPLAAGQVRVRTLLAGICGTDVTILKLGTGFYGAGNIFDTRAIKMGHENVGVVEAVGAGVDVAWIGKRVVASPAAYCSTCAPCARRRLNHCAARDIMAQGCSSSGTWSTHYVSDKKLLFEVPSSLSDKSAVLAEPLAVALHAAFRANLSPDATCLIIGAGSVGLLQVAAVRYLAPKATILVVARHAFQREAAKALGANHVLQSATPAVLAPLLGCENAKQHSGLLRALGAGDVLLGGVDVTFDCVSSAATLQTSVNATRRGGRVIFLGVGQPQKVALDAHLFREVDLMPSFVYTIEPDGRHTMAIALEMLSKVDLSALVTHVLPLGSVEEAVEIAADKRGGKVIKVALQP
jgi:threonine dehydrogenase-like Zn-dependent dehydrogenase